jgi:hypothetical protein
VASRSPPAIRTSPLARMEWPEQKALEETPIGVKESGSELRSSWTEIRPSVYGFGLGYCVIRG